MAGGKHMKGCCADCVLTTDDFNRDPENPPSGSWSVISGEWEVAGNQLRNVTPGPIITTVRPSPSQRPNTEYSTKIFFKCVNIAFGSVYEIICGYTDANNYDFIRLTADGTNLAFHPEFIRVTGGTPTVLMDETTHPGALTFTYDNPTSPSSDGFWEGKICYAENDWTLDAGSPSESGGPGININGSEDPWTYTGEGGQAVLPTGLGNAGFRDGDFDDFAFHNHWEAVAKCDYCSCLCKSTEDENEYAQFPETLKVLFIAEFDESSYTVDFNDGEILVTQADDNDPQNLSPTKYQWRNGSDGTGTPSDMNARFVCEGSGSTSKLGLTVPFSCSTMTYGDNDNSSGFTYADVDWENSTCDPLWLDFGLLYAGWTTCEIVPGVGPQGVQSCFVNGNPGAPACIDETDENKAFLEGLRWRVILTTP